jgi:hypothetical protein
MTSSEKHLGVIAALLFLGYILWKKYGTTTTEVQTTMLSSGQTTAPTTTVYDAGGNPIASNEQMLGPYAVQGAGVPANAGPAIYNSDGGYSAPVGFHVVDYGGTVPVIVPDTPSTQQKLSTGSPVGAIPRSEMIRAGTFWYSSVTPKAISPVTTQIRPGGIKAIA